MLGHYSAGFTLDTYAHVTTIAQRQAADVMGNVLSALSELFRTFPHLGQNMGQERFRTKRKTDETTVSSVFE